MKRPRADSDEWGSLDLSFIPNAELDLPAPELDERMLPAIILAVAKQVAYLNSCPIDFAVAGFINAAAGVIGSARKIVTGIAAWKEPSILWFMVVGLSGVRKSPASDYFKAIVREIEQQVQKDANGDVGEDGKEEPPPRMMFINTTIEALMGVLSRNIRGLWGCFDELGAWLNGFNQYKAGGGDREDWLSLYNGGYHTTDRVKGGQTAIAWAGVSIMGNITPGAAFRAVVGSRGDGMAERFVYFYPKKPPTKILPEEITQREADRINKQVRDALRRLRELKVGAEMTTDNKLRVEFGSEMGLTKAAWQRVREIEFDLQERMTGDDFMSRWRNKSAGRVLRVALVFKYLEWALMPKANSPGRIDVDTIEQAERFVNGYAEGMAKRVTRNLTLDDTTRLAIEVIDWVAEQRVETVNRSRLGQKNIKDLKNAAVAKEVFALLERANYLRRSKKSTFGRPALEWEVNPEASKIWTKSTF